MKQGMSGRMGAALALAAIIVVAAGVAIYLNQGPNSSGTSTVAGSGIQVVAAENFWGSLASQIGGTHANVISIVSDPNADPHEYETNSKNATAVANAKLVIMNGAGYDDWIGKLINASNTPGQKVLNVAKLLGYQQGDLAKFSNEHFWYNPAYVNKTVNAIYQDFVSIDPGSTAYYQQQYKALNSSLHAYMSIEANIKAKYSRTNVASTESIFLFMANATGLNVVTPFEFMKAVAEGNDPSAPDVATFQNQLNTPGLVKVLVYNQQTVTQTTDSMKALAAKNNIPLVAVTETLQPVNDTFQQWMTNELTALQTALGG